ncbi:hypothetical protein BDA96_08G068700 [Sorghum bicolor]|uniref:Uncharacterized protein n=3 Tax=Sorghum bicolor TaxID=4558 RepID=A0A921U6B1_SORBI|nr:hypothetical protein BDA96_08G068700 [Sorghum bicolor]OQU78864.1 hypothetical protein SORBI_3008G064300 [Sorghum bicolor]
MLRRRLRHLSRHLFPALAILPRTPWISRARSSYLSHARSIHPMRSIAFAAVALLQHAQLQPISNPPVPNSSSIFKPQLQDLSLLCPKFIPNRWEHEPRGKNLSSNSRRGTVAPVARAAISDLVADAPAAPVDGSTSATSTPAALAAAGSPTLPSLQATGFPAWWTGPSTVASFRHESSTIEGVSFSTT